MYWETTGCEALPELIGIAIFDIAVNSGPSNALRIMQRLAGVTNDGILGPKTKAAFAAVGGTSSLLMDVTDARMSFYCKIVQRDASQVVFINGWIRRARNLERSLLGM
jgi:lysozyme family protein